MVYGFVKQSAGHIKIYSEEGHGTTIKIYLPPGTGASLAPEAAIAPAIRGGHETILVVERRQTGERICADAIAFAGLRHAGCGERAEALAIIAAGNHFDLLFTDVIMPGAMNGRQLATEVQKSKPELKVLFTSGYTEMRSFTTAGSTPESCCSPAISQIGYGRNDPKGARRPEPYLI